MLKKNLSVVLFISFALIGVCLFIPFKSIQWDLNGIIEAEAVESGVKGLFCPNHMLYRGIGYIVYQIVKGLGYVGKSAIVLQYLTAILSAMGLGFFIVTLNRASGLSRTSIFVTIFFATSWSYWVFSTDISYITPAAMLVCATLALLFSKQHNILIACMIGVLCSLSILFWQANIFLIPIYLMLLLFWHNQTNTIYNLKNIGIFLGVVILITGSIYILVGRILYDCATKSDMIAWLFSHSSSVSGTPLLWGKWEADRILSVGVSVIGSFIPLWEGIGLSELMQGEIQPYKIPGQLSFVALLLIIIFSLVIFIQKRSRVENIRIIILVLAYIIYLPFIIWWDPYEPKWFVIPNIFLLIAIACLWSSSMIRYKSKLLLAACIGTIAFANFTLTIFPRHIKQNNNMQIAECFTRSTDPLDTYLSLDWNWFGYAKYFFGYEGEGVWMIRGEDSEKQNQYLARTIIHQTTQRGGKVYLTKYSEEQLEWIEEDLGVKIKSLLELSDQKLAFSCGGIQFIEIVKVK